MTASCVIQIGPQLRRELDEYLRFRLVVHRQKLDPNEAATNMLWSFLDTNGEYLEWKQQRIVAGPTLAIQGSAEDETEAQGQAVTSMQLRLAVPAAVKVMLDD